MPRSFKHMLDAAYEDQPIQQVLDAPTSAIQGVSIADADRLRAAFGIQTIREMAENDLFANARAMLAAGGKPAFDPGPTYIWQELFARAPLDHFMNHPSGRFRLDYGPVYYRGRLDGTARVLIVGQDPASNEILAQRILVGRSGQLVQGLLRKIGITRSYVMFNTFLYSIFDQPDAEMKAISLEPEVQGYREELLNLAVATNRLDALIVVGSGARHAIDHWQNIPNNIARFDIVHPAADDALVADNWNQAMPGMRNAIDPDDDGVVDPAPYTAPLGNTFLTDIPRFDLPFGMPDWHGRNGGHSDRDGNKKIIWTAP